MENTSIKEKLCALSVLKHLERRCLSLQEARSCRYYHLRIYDFQQITYILDTLLAYGMVFSQINHTDRLYYITPQGNRLLAKLDKERV